MGFASILYLAISVFSADQATPCADVDTRRVLASDDLDVIAVSGASDGHSKFEHLKNLMP